MIQISEYVEQLSKHQDYTISGETRINETPVKYAAVFDGHGTSEVIQFIRRISKLKLNEIMATNCPATTLYNYINASYVCQPGRSSGSTMCMARIFPEYVELLNVGDSQVVVFKNGNLEFVSDTHGYENDAEMARLTRENRIFKSLDSKTIKIVNDKKMFYMKSKYIIHVEGWGLLAVTQALGHAGKTGICPTRTEIPYIAGEDDVRIVLGSDGVFDMILRDADQEDQFIVSDIMEMMDMSAEEIGKRASNRWLQSWEMHYDLNDPSLYEVATYRNEDADDVSVVKIVISPETP